MKNSTSSTLLAGLVCTAFLTPSARAVTIQNLTTNTTLFSDKFESGTTPSTPSAGSWGIFGPGVTVSNAGSPGPAEGSFYVQLFRDSNTNNQGNLAATLSASQTTIGDVILLRMMVYLPSATNVDATGQFMLANGDFGNARAWVRPDGTGHVEAVEPGLTNHNTLIPYATDAWQEWDLQYTIGASTFIVTVNGVSAVAASFTVGDVTQANLFNGVSTPGSLFLDAVPPPSAAGVPEPGSLSLIGAGLAGLAVLRGAYRRLRR